MGLEAVPAVFGQMRHCLLCLQILDQMEKTSANLVTELLKEVTIDIHLPVCGHLTAKDTTLQHQQEGKTVGLKRK